MVPGTNEGKIGQEVFCNKIVPVFVCFSASLSINDWKLLNPPATSVENTCCTVVLYVLFFTICHLVEFTDEGQEQFDLILLINLKAYNIPL